MLNNIRTNTGFQVIVDDEVQLVDKEHANYDELWECVKNDDEEGFMDLYTIENMVTNHFEDTGVEVQDGQVLYNGQVVENTLADMIIDLTEEGDDAKYMVRFLDNLMDNPSKRAVDELYDFLAHRGMPITEDGCFVAYKAVRGNYRDKYTNTIDNSVGQVVEMPRNQVDDDKSRTCSYGYHVGAFSYAGTAGWYYNSGDHVMKVKVNPRDAVSVPADHNATKLRVCRYEVIGEHKSTKEIDSLVYKDDQVGSHALSDEDQADHDDEQYGCWC